MSPSVSTPEYGGGGMYASGRGENLPFGSSVQGESLPFCTGTNVPFGRGRIYPSGRGESLPFGTGRKGFTFWWGPFSLSEKSPFALFQGCDLPPPQRVKRSNFLPVRKVKLSSIKAYGEICRETVSPSKVKNFRALRALFPLRNFPLRPSPLSDKIALRPSTPPPRWGGGKTTTLGFW